MTFDKGTQRIGLKLCAGSTNVKAAGLGGHSMGLPSEQFENPGVMASALEVAVNTLRLRGEVPDDETRFELARRIMAASSEGTANAVLLAEAALGGDASMRLSQARG
jgi:hypothetical protein